MKVRARELNLDNVKFMPAVELGEVGNYLHAADALLVHLIAEPLFQITIPGKIQAYMALGKPMIMGVQGDAKNLVSMANCGVCIESQNANSLAQAAKKLMLLSPMDLQTLGKNGSSFYDDNLSVKIGSKSWIETSPTVMHGKNS